MPSSHNHASRLRQQCACVRALSDELERHSACDQLSELLREQLTEEEARLARLLEEPDAVP